MTGLRVGSESGLVQLEVLIIMIMVILLSSLQRLVTVAWSPSQIAAGPGHRDCQPGPELRLDLSQTFKFVGSSESVLK